MHRLTRVQREIVDALEFFGAGPRPGSVRSSGNGITFQFADTAGALDSFRNRGLFAQGRLGILHSRAVGGVLTEYRSYRRGKPHSLHVVVGKARAFADLDRFNPYQHPADLIRHGFLELMPYLLRVAFGRGVG